MITELDVDCGGKYIQIHVIRSSRRSVALEVRPNGTVLARIPYMFPDLDLKEFIGKHERWIFEKSELSKRRINAGKSKEVPTLDQLTTKEIENIKRKITDRVRHYCDVMGVSAGRITIRNQKTRWGSCSTKGNLNFNYQLFYLPDEILDYVVVHELAHRRYMNHSQEFWAEVEKYSPNYREYRKWLKEYPCV